MRQAKVELNSMGNQYSYVHMLIMANVGSEDRKDSQGLLQLSSHSHKCGRMMKQGGEFNVMWCEVRGDGILFFFKSRKKPPIQRTGYKGIWPPRVV